MTKILNVKIKDGGDFVEIETDNDDCKHQDGLKPEDHYCSGHCYKYIWLDADDLATIADMVEYL